MKRIWTLILLVALASGCSPVRSDAEATVLPPPQVHMVTVAPGVVESSEPKPASTSAPIRATAVDGSLEEMARAVYGEQLIAEIRIGSIQVTAPVTPVGWQMADLAGEQLEWESPDASVGWAVSSALPGQNGNVILYGHNNLHSNVFMRLSEVRAGDGIDLRTGEGVFHYRVESVEVIPVDSAEADSDAARKYIQSGDEELVTIISCWPPSGNTHRVIVIARP